MKQKILKISQVKIDEQLYPRTKYDWFTAYDYKNSMEAGAKFPPIEVAFFNKQYYLIDGRHRIEAVKLLKQKHVQCIIHEKLQKKDIYLLAIQRNINHGRPLSPQDKAMVIDNLVKLRLSSAEISSIIQIPIDKLEKFKFNKITSTISGESVYLKGTVKNYAGQEVSEDFDMQQDNFSTRGQVALLNQVVKLLENGLLDLDNPRVLHSFRKLKVLVKSITFKVR